jgi:hypothetical protein
MINKEERNEKSTVINTFGPGGIWTLKSTMPGHFTTLWKSRSTSTPSGRLAWEAAEYMYSAGTESVNIKKGILIGFLNKVYINHWQKATNSGRSLLE